MRPFRTLLAWLRPKPDNAAPESDARRTTRVHFDAVTEQHLAQCAEQARQDKALAARKLLRPYHAAAAHLGHERRKGRA